MGKQKKRIGIIIEAFDVSMLLNVVKDNVEVLMVTYLFNRLLLTVVSD